MKNYNYFNPMPETLEELKAQYRKFAFRHHPDRGGSDEEMKVVNGEYDELFLKLKDVHRTKEGKTYTKESAETPEQYREIVYALLMLHMEGVDIEIIGSFIWLSGNTKPYKEAIKALGFKWSQNKTAWYLPPDGYKKFGRKQFDLDEIREMYSSTRVNGDGERTEIKIIAG